MATKTKQRIDAISGPILTLTEASRWLQVKPDEVRLLADQGKLPGQKFSDGWRFSTQALHDWLGKTHPPVTYQRPEWNEETEKEMNEFLAVLAENRRRFDS